MNEILKRLAEIKAEAEALRTSDDAGRVTKLNELLAEQRDLKAKLETEQALDELTAEVPVAEDEKPAEEAPAEEAPAEDAPEAPAEDEKPAEAVVTEVPLAVAAAGTVPVDTDVATTESAKPMALVASGNVAGTNPGSPLGAHEMQRIHRHAGKANAGTRTVFANMHVADGEHVSEGFTPEQNSAIMAAATGASPQPITAAAAFCGPDDIVLDICAAGTDARPVQGLFRTVPVRGKFRYMKTATLAEVAPGIEIWEEGDQIDLDVDDPDTWKPCVDLSCRAETTVTPYGVPACTTMGVWQQLSAPEQIANWLLQMQKQYARVAETKLLDRIRDQSFVYSAGAVGQGLWTTLQPILAAIEAQVGAVNRGTTEGYVIIAPYGFTAALAADETMRGFSQNLAVQRIQALLAENYGVRIVESYETDSTAAAGFNQGGDLPAGLGGAATPIVLGTNTAATYPLYILNPDSYVAGNSSVVDAGYYRDSTNVRQNLVRYFWEGMEFLEHTCDHLSYVVELDTCPNGAAAPVGDDILCDAAL